MKYLHVLLIYAFSLFAFPAEALVAQKASSALRSDNFVDTGSSSSGKSSFSSSSKHEDRKQQIEAAKQKRKAAHEKFLNKKKIRSKESSAQRFETDGASSSTETLNSTEYKKQLASRFPKAISGYITIEQNNLPKKIIISKDAVVQLEMASQENAFWFTEVNEKVLSVQKNEINDGKTIIVLQPTKAGSSRIVLDFISREGSEHKVLMTKKFNIVVSE